MSLAAFLALMGFAFVTTVTPGPNNLMLMASGANFGYRRTFPHILGILIGFSVMVLMVGFGLMAMFEAFPALYNGLKIVSVAYLLWLAWKIANAASPKATSAGGRPLTFLQAAAFQWVNPKAWAVGLSTITLCAPDRSPLSTALVMCAFALVSLPANSLWAWIGTMVKRWLSNQRRLMIFNITMALLLVASLYPALFLH